jgi:hypothetical protein
MTLPDFPLLFYPAAAVGILITGMSKGGFGAAGGVAVPMMAMFIAPAQAAGIMLPLLCAMDLFGVHAYRGLWSWRYLRILLPGALVGIALGAIGFGVLPDDGLRLAIGAIAIAFALNQMLRVSERIASRLDAERSPPGRVAGFFWGAMSGFTSTLAHAGGPPFAIYMLPQRLDRTVFVAISVFFFLVVNYVKLVPYAMLGQLSPSNLTASLIFAPLAPLGIWLGVWLHRRISNRVFYSVSYWLLLATGLKLVYDGLA